MKICKQCNLTYWDEVNYCPKCGQLVEPVDEKNTCSKCGFELEEYMSFCPKCGNQINYSEENVSTPTVSNREPASEDNLSNAIPQSNSLLSKGQIIYTLICIGVAIISFIGMKTQVAFGPKLICALVAGMVVLYILIVWNYVRKQYTLGNTNKAAIVGICGVVGFVIVSAIYWTVLSSYSLCVGIPVHMSLTNGLARMIGTTLGGVGVIAVESAVVFFIGRFIHKAFQKK